MERGEDRETLIDKGIDDGDSSFEIRRQVNTEEFNIPLEYIRADIGIIFRPAFDAGNPQVHTNLLHFLLHAAGGGRHCKKQWLVSGCQVALCKKYIRIIPGSTVAFVNDKESYILKRVASGNKVVFYYLGCCKDHRCTVPVPGALVRGSFTGKHGKRGNFLP